MNRAFGYEEFHTCSKNPAAYKHVVTAHKLHYDPHVIELQVNAPLHVATNETVELGEPDMVREGFARTILARRSTRTFNDASLSIGQLSSLLFYANGIQKGGDPGLIYKRNVPNSGNLGSVELFVVIRKVEGVTPGIYHYDSLENRLAVLQKGSFSQKFREDILFQPEYAQASILIILTSAVGRLAEKYGERGYRLGLLDVGHVSQNLNLMATEMSLSVCPTAGFIDDAVEDLLGIDGLTRCVFLMVAVGA